MVFNATFNNISVTVITGAYCAGFCPDSLFCRRGAHYKQDLMLCKNMMVTFIFTFSEFMQLSLTCMRKLKTVRLSMDDRCLYHLHIYLIISKWWQYLTWPFGSGEVKMNSDEEIDNVNQGSDIEKKCSKS
jgi:hypothetical protein